MKKKYKIKLTTNNVKEIITTLLGVHSFVFNLERYRTWESVELEIIKSDKGLRWPWILLGYTDRCSKTIIPSRVDWDGLDDYKEITLDEFIKKELTV